MKSRESPGFTVHAMLCDRTWLANGEVLVEGDVTVLQQLGLITAA